jgi:N-acetylglucosaminyl-diphospho-decaprenol L-rhamnosyltransferase
MNFMPELSIITVNWNCGELLQRCIECIEQHPPAVEYEILVIDNASSDDSLHFLESDRGEVTSSRVTVIKNQENRGFAKASNQGILASQSPLLLLLNPDTEVRPGAIDALIAAVRSEARVGVSGPRLLNTDGSLQPSVWPSLPMYLYCFFDDLQLCRLLPNRLRGELLKGRFSAHDARRVVKCISGAVLMVKREVVDDIGPYNEHYHMYGEDIEWQLRIERAGWKTIFEPAAVIVHHGGQSALKRWTGNEIRVREIDGTLRLQRDCYSPLYALLSTIARVFTFSVVRAKRRFSNEDSRLLDDLIALQVSYFKLSLRDLLNRGQRQAADF